MKSNTRKNSMIVAVLVLVVLLPGAIGSFVSVGGHIDRSNDILNPTERDAGCPKADYWPLNKKFTFRGFEPPSFCFNGSVASNETSVNGFSVVFDDVVIQPDDQLCALIATTSFSSQDISYVITSCGIGIGSSLSYGGICKNRALDTNYLLAIASKSAIFSPIPKHTLLQFTFHFELSDTRVC